MGRRVLRAFLYQRELTPIVITIALFLYFAVRAGSNFTGSLSLSSAVGYAGQKTLVRVWDRATGKERFAKNLDEVRWPTGQLAFSPLQPLGQLADLVVGLG